jgi:Tfp pilus assembly protein PilF
MPRRARKTHPDQPQASGRQAPRKRLERFLKWVGGVTAILSLILGLYQVTRLVSDVRERQRHLAELYAVGKEQQSAGDFQSAWTSFEQALKTADEGGQIAKLAGQLGAERHQLREAQEDLAMVWLENIRVPQGQRFSDIVDKLVPILSRGVGSASGLRKADLLGHVGWAYFLKARDGSGNLNPEQHYRQALEIDPGNPYAHAHWGHWILRNRENLADATRHFSAAVASGRALPYVRQIQLAALGNVRSERTQEEFLRVVNDMLKNNEKIEARTRSDVYSIYYFALSAGETFQRLRAAVPATEQIAMIRALFYETDFDRSKIPNREASLAILQEAAGLRDEALATWLAMRSGLPANTRGPVVDRADAAIKRLSQPQSTAKGRAVGLTSPTPTIPPTR